MKVPSSKKVLRLFAAIRSYIRTRSLGSRGRAGTNVSSPAIRGRPSPVSAAAVNGVPAAIWRRKRSPTGLAGSIRLAVSTGGWISSTGVDAAINPKLSCGVTTWRNSPASSRTVISEPAGSTACTSPEASGALYTGVSSRRRKAMFPSRTSSAAVSSRSVIGG